MVEAIVDGRIVSIDESVAKREGYPILRKPEPVSFLPTPEKLATKPVESRGIKPFDDFRKPLKKQSNNVAGELANNFNWLLQSRRREMRLTRKQVADKIGISEYELKLVENGILPKDDFVIVSKLEQFYSISLRKGMFSEMPEVPSLDTEDVVEKA